MLIFYGSDKTISGLQFNGIYMLKKRGCGILLHPTSLPGPGGIGSLGADARRFINLLSDMGMSYWQVLPLTPPACGNSPYSAFTAFGVNPFLIDLERVASEGDLSHASCCSCSPEERVDYTTVARTKIAGWMKALKNDKTFLI
jgi:4-alpha-glucanotransferase